MRPSLCRIVGGRGQCGVRSRCHAPKKSCKESSLVRGSWVSSGLHWCGFAKSPPQIPKQPKATGQHTPRSLQGRLAREGVPAGKEARIPLPRILPSAPDTNRARLPGSGPPSPREEVGSGVSGHKVGARETAPRVSRSRVNKPSLSERGVFVPQGQGSSRLCERQHRSPACLGKAAPRTKTPFRLGPAQGAFSVKFGRSQV